MEILNKSVSSQSIGEEYNEFQFWRIQPVELPCGSSAQPTQVNSERVGLSESSQGDAEVSFLT